MDREEYLKYYQYFQDVLQNTVEYQGINRGDDTSISFTDSKVQEEFKNSLGEEGLDFVNRVLGAKGSFKKFFEHELDEPEKFFDIAKNFIEQSKLKEFEDRLETTAYIFSEPGVETFFHVDQLEKQVTQTGLGKEFDPDKMDEYLRVIENSHIQDQIKQGEEAKELTQYYLQELKNKGFDTDDHNIRIQVHKEVAGLVKKYPDAAYRTDAIEQAVQGVRGLLDDPMYVNFHGNLPENGLDEVYVGKRFAITTQVAKGLKEKDFENYQSYKRIFDNLIIDKPGAQARADKPSTKPIKDENLLKVLKDIKNSDKVLNYMSEQKIKKMQHVEKAKANFTSTVRAYMNEDYRLLTGLGKLLIDDDPALHRNSGQYNNLTASLTAFAKVKKSENGDFDAAAYKQLRKDIEDKAMVYLQDKWKDRSTDLGKRRFVETMNILKALNPQRAATLEKGLNKERMKNQIGKIDFRKLEQKVTGTKADKQNVLKNQPENPKKEAKKAKK